MRYWIVFHVYVEGVTASGPDAVRRLADVMAARYGLPAAEVHARLTRGRFRVKANVDHATADRYARDLETIGARVRIEEAQASDGTSTPSGPAERHLVPAARRGVRTSPALIPRAAISSTPAPTPRPSLSGVPCEPALRPSLAALPPQPAQRPTLSTLPPQPAQRPTLSTLPPQPVGRPVPSTLPPQPSSRPAGSSLPPQLASRPSAPALPAHVPSRATSSPLPAHLASRPPPRALPPSDGSDADPSGGLAMTGTAPSGDEVLDLGALDRSGLLSLATLDDDAAPPSAVPSSAYAATEVPLELVPDVQREAPGAPGTRRPVPPRPAEPARAPAPPLDQFAPPSADGLDLVVELADDELAYRARKRSSAPPAVTSEQAASGVPARLTTLVEPAHAAPVAASRPPATPRLTPTPERPAGAAWTSATAHRALASPRVRLAAGVLLAILLGFIPAHIVASIREDRAFREIDARVIEAQAAVDSPQSYEALAPLRATQLDAKRSAHRRIALVSLLIWAASGSAVAYVWFRRVPWSR